MFTRPFPIFGVLSWVGPWFLYPPNSISFFFFLKSAILRFPHSLFLVLQITSSLEFLRLLSRAQLPPIPESPGKPTSSSFLSLPLCFLHDVSTPFLLFFSKRKNRSPSFSAWKVVPLCARPIFSRKFSPSSLILSIFLILSFFFFFFLRDFKSRPLLLNRAAPLLGLIKFHPPRNQ